MNQTPILDKTWRRHTDPPGLWIAVALISITLHLLLFWLLRSYGFSLLQKSTSNPIPVEFVEISSGKASITATTSPKRQSTTPRQVTSRNLTKSSAIEDSNAIALTNNVKASQTDAETVKEQNPKIQNKKQQQTKLQSEQTTKPKPTSKPESIRLPYSTKDKLAEPTNEPNITENTDTDRFSENQDNGDPHQPLNPQNNTPSPNSSPETNSHSPQSESTVPNEKETPSEDLETPAPVQSEQSLPPDEQPRGLAIATWDVEAEAEQKDIPENLAKPISNLRQKELNSFPLEEEPLSQPVSFQVSLLIDSNGNCLDVYISPTIQEPQRSQYREYALELFRDEKFIPASRDGKKPPVSNLVVRVNIPPKSP